VVTVTPEQQLPPEEPILDIDEIQGNAVPGFMKSHMTVVVLAIEDPEKARGWIANTLEHVTSLATVMKSRHRVRAARTLRPKGEQVGAVPSDLDDVWVNLAFSYRGLSKLATGRAPLARSLNEFSDTAFKLGLAARSSLLGDPTDPDAEGHPSNWVVGSPHKQPDVLLIVAADDESRAATMVAALREDAESRGLAVLHEELGAKYDRIGKEHFGFQDGISQPGVRGRLSKRAGHFLGHRTISTSDEPDTWLYDLPGQLLVWPGEFVFGYPKASVDPLLPGPINLPGPRWSRNGSYVVYRRLRQDVAGFWSFINDEAEKLRSKPGFEQWTADRLAAAIVGRWRSGAPLLRAAHADNETLGLDRQANNIFGYATDAGTLDLTDGSTTNDRRPNAPADPVGLICPQAAHIRKVNPREAPNDFGASRSSLNRRILRRGIPYGPPLTDHNSPDPARGNRGLVFLSYQASITDQFEFLNTNWMGNPITPRSPSGFDMLVGQNGHPGENRERHCTLFGQDLSSAQVSTTADYVTPTGGGYFFSPSIQALRAELA
jgi:Dyp-type peroxidase family